MDPVNKRNLGGHETKPQQSKADTTSARKGHTKAMSIKILNMNPEKFADEVLEEVANNLEYAARECGLDVTTAEGKALGEWDCRRSTLHFAIVEVILYVQGKRNGTAEMVDAITAVANMAYVVKDHRRIIDEAVRVAGERISTTPLEEEDA